MSNHISHQMQVAKVLDKAFTLYEKYLPSDNAFDKILLENLGYIFPINKNYCFEFSAFNPAVIGGNIWLCYKGTRIINIKSGAYGFLKSVASGLTLGMTNSSISFCTKDPSITNKEFVKELIQEIKDSLPVLEKILINNSSKISQLHDDLKRRNIHIKQKELYNSAELSEKCKQNREFIGLDF